MMASSDDDDIAMPPPLKDRIRKTPSSSSSTTTTTTTTTKAQQSTTKAQQVYKSATSKASILLTALLQQLFSQRSSPHALSFVRSTRCKSNHRKTLARLAGLTDAWIDCNQAIQSNVKELAEHIVSELYVPFWFYRSSLFGCNPRSQPRALFQAQRATPPLTFRKSSSFWTAPNGTKTTTWLPTAPATTFDAVVHFIQSGSGTGVHIGNGLLLTCAHVIDSRADEEEEEEEDGGGGGRGVASVPNRIGRQKVVMFASGRCFLTECCSQVESIDGSGEKDCCCTVLGTEIDVECLPLSLAMDDDDEEEQQQLGRVEDSNNTSLASAVLATNAPLVGTRLFCIGNPSSIDLESCTQGTIEFEPPCWHLSAGHCINYLDPAVNIESRIQSDRGRAPTRGELKKLQTLAAIPFTNSKKGVFIEHSCWTYWGHSGAPLFDDTGAVVGLHCAWDDKSGIRHGQKLQHLQLCVAQANTNVAVANDTRGACGKQSKKPTQSLKQRKKKRRKK